MSRLKERREKVREKLIQNKGVISDQVLQKEFGMSKEAIRRFRKREGIPLYKNAIENKIIEVAGDDLGVEPDTVIAKKAGVSTYLVRKAREKRGKFKTIRDGGKRLHKMLGEEGYQAFLNELGTMSDQKLADKYGISQSITSRYRRSQKILPYSQTKNLQKFGLTVS